MKKANRITAFTFAAATVAGALTVTPATAQTNECKKYIDSLEESIIAQIINNQDIQWNTTLNQLMTQPINKGDRNTLENLRRELKPFFDESYNNRKLTLHEFVNLLNDRCKTRMLASLSADGSQNTPFL